MRKRKRAVAARDGSSLARVERDDVDVVGGERQRERGAHRSGAGDDYIVEHGRTSRSRDAGFSARTRPRHRPRSWASPR